MLDWLACVLNLFNHACDLLPNKKCPREAVGLRSCVIIKSQDCPTDGKLFNKICYNSEQAFTSLLPVLIFFISGLARPVFESGQVRLGHIYVRAV